MESQVTILSFLDRVRRLRLYVHALHGTFILLAYITGSYLLACLLALSYEPIVEWTFLAIGIFCGGLIYIIFNYVIRILITPFSQDDAALLAESRYPEINNSLINSSQLGRLLKDPHSETTTSLNFIEELQRRTSTVVNKIDPITIIDQSRMTIGRNWLLGTLGSLVLIALVVPEFLTKGYERWTNQKGPTQVSQEKIANQNRTSSKPTAVNYSIESLDLTFHFPSYTGKKTELIKSSDGKIHVLPGTEVDISAKTNVTVSGADMIFNEKDNFAMSKENEVHLKASLLVKEKGFYQFSVKDRKGNKHLLATKYPVTLAKDQSPNIVLFLANPKPVYFYTDKVQLFYEGKDDFGINAVELVVFINGEINRIPVKKFRNQEKEAKDSYTWALVQMAINPGDEVNYYLEIKDNDNVFGPNKGQSETYSFSIFDSKREMENLIVMQEELTEKMITLLATGLVKGASLKSQPNDLMGWKQLFTTSVDELIKVVSLAQRIYDKGKTIDRFPQHYLSLLKNITRGLSRIRKNQIEALSDLQNKIHKPTQAKFETSSSYDSVNSQMTEHLEKDILFLVKMTNEQKLNKMIALEEELNELIQTLREDFENINNGKSPKISDELKNKINKIQKTLQKIMDQLARQTQSMPDEFLNPNAFKRLNMEKLSVSLKKMQRMISRGRFEEAMEELKQMEEDLKLLANQINRADSEMENFLDPEIMGVLDSGIKKLDQLKNRQQNLVEETTQMNQKLRQRQSEEFDDQLDKFFKDLLRDVNSIRKIFKENKKFLEEHAVMNQLQKLIDKEIEINQKIKELGQATVDSTQSEKLDQHFNKLKEARKSHSKLIKEKDSLRVNEFQRFKEALPQLLKKYDSLNKLAKLQDLKEFASLFKQAYPNVLRWQNSLGTTPNLREDLSNRLDGDLTQTTRLNNEISKKLGSMIRAIRKNYNSSITMDQKKELKQMEKQEYRIRKESEELSQRFDQLSRENPMIPPELVQGMKQTEHNMERAEANLREQNIQRSIESENLALKGLGDTRDLLNRMKNSNEKMGRAQRQTPRKLGTGSSPDSRRGGATRMQKERVLLPAEDQYKVPKEFREEILNAMKKQTPKDYERMVMEYYKYLIK